MVHFTRAIARLTSAARRRAPQGLSTFSSAAVTKPTATTSHLERTQGIPRTGKSLTPIPCTVVTTAMTTPTIKSVLLQVSRPADVAAADFTAGQWVDLVIPDVVTVGGFSLTSTPRQLHHTGTLEIAVKKASPHHTPARWVHEECQPGANVAIRVGGAMTFSLESHLQEGPRDLILVAGGIGITPLLSILKEACQYLPSGWDVAESDQCLGVVPLLRQLQQSAREHPPQNPPFRVSLLYSVTTEAEVAFLPVLRELLGACSHVRASFFVTRGQVRNLLSLGTHFGSVCGEDELFPLATTPTSRAYYRRLQVADLRHAVGEHHYQQQSQQQLPPLCFVCGPSPMLTSVISDLHTACGVPLDSIRYENWGCY